MSAIMPAASAVPSRLWIHSPTEPTGRSSRKSAMMSPALRLALVVGGAAAYLGLTVLGWGGLAAFFSHPALIALANRVLRAVRRGALRRGECQSRSARGSGQPLGPRSLRGDRAARRLCAGLDGPKGVLDPRWRHHPLAWHRSLRGRWRAAALAGFRARPPVQQAGGDPARAYAGDHAASMASSVPSYLGFLVNALGWGLPFVRASACCSPRS